MKAVMNETMKGSVPGAIRGSMKEPIAGSLNRSSPVLEITTNGNDPFANGRIGIDPRCINPRAERSRKRSKFVPKPDMPKPDMPKPDLLKLDLPKSDLPKSDLPKSKTVPA